MPTVLITGTSRGIGLELAKTLASRGWHVIATARELAKASVRSIFRSTLSPCLSIVNCLSVDAEKGLCTSSLDP